MVSLKSVERQLKKIDANYKFWGRPEIVELSKILMEDEKIAQCVNGTYEGGVALFCATDHRVLLVDKKPMYLTIEDIRYDMISDINYNYRLLSSTLQIMTGVKTLQFSAWSHHRLRSMMSYVQQRVTELRHRKSDTEKAEMKIAEEIEESEKQPAKQPIFQQIAEQPVRQPDPVFQTAATNSMDDNFDGWRRHVAAQLAHYVGRRAVAFSQMPPALSRYKLPLPRRSYRHQQST